MTPTQLLTLCARSLLHGYAIRRFRRHRDLLDQDEIRSAADEGIVEASRRFDPEKGAFTAFARFWVRRQVQRAIAQELFWRRKRIGEGDGAFDELVEALEGEERLEEQVAARDLVKRLDPVEHEMWAKHSTGRSLRELAKDYDISIRQVRQQMDRSRRALDSTEPRDTPADSAQAAARHNHKSAGDKSARSGLRATKQRSPRG